ncbi:hypothetical protein M9434_002589 [Picochlorum sp. BPE23]|nr:hypothetical protein M9434_002589 [Picochlorum sp. BPE23]
MDGGWKPDDGCVQRVAGLLNEFQSPGANQHQILSHLEEWCSSYRDYPSYLAYILVSGDGLAGAVRQSAGLFLKNSLRHVIVSNAVPDVIETVKQILVHGLRCADRTLRHTAATCVATLTSCLGFSKWPSLLRDLQMYLNSGDECAMDGALNAIQKTWEDSPGRMEEDVGDSTSANDCLLPLVLAQMGNAAVHIPVASINILNYALFNQSSKMDELISAYKAGLFSLAHHPEAAVRRVVCIGLIHLSELAPSQLEGELSLLIQYMIDAMQDPQHDVAIEASEFWSVFPEAGFDGELLKPFVPRLIPLLVKNMEFDEFDEQVAEAEAYEEEKRESASELRPHLHASVSHAQISKDGEMEKDQEADVEWNLRKSSAAGLDMLSGLLGDDILPTLLPVVESNLQQGNWKAREAAILTLGAVSNGCHTGLKEHTHAIISAVLPGLVDQRPMIRCISCWTLTRYSRNVYSNTSEGDGTLLERVTHGIIDRVVKDRNKIVQIAACGSLATLVEEDPVLIKPYIPEIFSALSFGLQHYGKGSLRAVYDSISIIALSSCEIIQRQEYADILLPSLFGKLDTFKASRASAEDPEILPLLDCIGTVGSEAGSSLLSYAQNVFHACMSLAEGYYHAGDATPVDPEEQVKFVEHTLDTLSGIIQGLGPSIAPLFSSSSLGSLLVKVSVHSSPALRQSAFGLVGDLAAACMLELLPFLSPLMEAILECIQPENIIGDNIDACNNAVWALGVVAKKCSSQDVAQFAMISLERLLPILTVPVGVLPRSLVENAAVCLGQIGNSTPETIAPHTSAFMGGWCAALRGLRDGDEKQDAQEGLCSVINANPLAAKSHFAGICECFATWSHTPKDPLPSQMAHIISGYKSQFESDGQWDSVAACVHPAVRKKLNL